MMRTMMRMELMLLTGAVERRKGRRRKEGEWLVENPRAHSPTNHKIFRFVKTIAKLYLVLTIHFLSTSQRLGCDSGYVVIVSETDVRFDGLLRWIHCKIRQLRHK